MATITTYLLVSNPDHPEAVREHSLFSAFDFDHRETIESGQRQLPALRFAIQHRLEEDVELEEAVRRFSRDVPEATVVLSEVEERFDQVERLQVVVFRDGKRGGNVEHGYIYNVGPE